MVRRCVRSVYRVARRNATIWVHANVGVLLLEESRNRAQDRLSATGRQTETSPNCFCPCCDRQGQARMLLVG